MSYLYRGVTKNHHENNGGKLTPKMIAPFKYNFKWNEPGLKWDSGGTYDETQDNAVVRHQLNQEGFPTSGLSTTPHLSRAQIYAKGKSGASDGYIYKIDHTLIKEYGVREFIVADYATQPSIPEDDEVILVASDYGVIPESVVVEILTIRSESNI